MFIYNTRLGLGVFAYFLSLQRYYIENAIWTMTSFSDFDQPFGQPIATFLIKESITLLPVSSVSISR